MKNLPKAHQVQRTILKPDPKYKRLCFWDHPACIILLRIQVWSIWFCFPKFALLESIIA
jgi:hypothetical protein